MARPGVLGAAPGPVPQAGKMPLQPKASSANRGNGGRPDPVGHAGLDPAEVTLPAVWQGQEKACTGPDHLGRVRGELTFGGLLCWLGDQDYSGLRPSPFGPPARCACVGSATLRIRTWGQPLPQSAAMLESAFFPKQGALCGAAVILRSSSATQRSGKMRPNPKGPAGFGPWRCCATGPVAQATEPAPRLAR